jgi:hypothetical protein
MGGGGLPGKLRLIRQIPQNAAYLVDKFGRVFNKVK